MKMNKKQKAEFCMNLFLNPCMSVDEVVNAFFKHDAETILNAMASNAKDPSEILEILAKASYEIENDTVLGGKSVLGDVQTKIVEQMANADNLDFFKTQVISSEEVVGGTCPDLDAAGMVISGIEQNSKGFERTMSMN